MSEEHGEELERGKGVGAGGGTFALVGGEADFVLRGDVLQALEGDGCAGRVARELEDAESVFGFEPDGVVHVEARVLPGQHRTVIVFVDDDGCTWLSRPQTELYLVAA